MFAGLHEDNIFIRLSEKDCEKVLAIHEGVHPFEPMKGHIMKEYVVVPKSIYAHSTIFKKLLELSYQYVASLPPIIPKKGNDI